MPLLLSSERRACEAQAVLCCYRNDLIHILGDAEVALSHLNKEVLKPAWSEDDQMTAGLITDPKSMFVSPRDESSLTCAFDNCFSIKPKLALTSQNDKNLVLPLMNVSWRATTSRTQAVHYRHRAA